MTTKYNHYILDNVLNNEELLWIYHELLDSKNWHIGNTSINKLNSFNSWPGMVIQDHQNIQNKYFAGYFMSVIFRIKEILKRDYSFDLPNNIIRIKLSAKSSFSNSSPHIDSEKKDYWTILGFLNPVWNANDGGEFFLEKTKIVYKSGRFIIFPSNILHDGGFVKNEKLSYWRIVSNIILAPS